MTSHAYTYVVGLESNPLGNGFGCHEVEILGTLQGIYVGDLGWQDQAACKGMPTDWWFPEQGASRECKRAKAICHNCPVRTQCLEYAVSHQEQWGLWGELSLKDRRRWNQERKAG
ncbi:transcriptional regulator [Mycobacteroides abscessus subsp. massiliense]|uniref:WhiB family transcriptional regulator n=1 Tax=Mycobacteroides abscessus TaxID=36809 RepID=UPI0009A90C3D|nr:WhiB family transcriptional regulator [Mycobacteroides abscessus]SKD93945.1 transcriptional regulator [Mycobacteroides abscessus subsp. massiliense]SKE06783.1 transcriptional regulator [Mycobacteroides abscessus subsp. massiliense]SKE08199.1 transcriptional regulator [Mycobacteroides abscessus subsp. massiliense]SKE60177.1 transcriptional regulator [Mycobacteroides abscessus subsp. massiliense]SKE61727.1 transcriptional regulator [Mycobacteroides abscessus subsp. massiliense]